MTPMSKDGWSYKVYDQDTGQFVVMPGLNPAILDLWRNAFERVSKELEDLKRRTS